MKIEVLDVNDNRPTIEILTQTTSVDLTTPSGFNIATFTVNDKDTFVNGQVYTQFYLDIHIIL